MADKPKPDLDERFSLYPEDPEEVLRTLLRKRRDDDQADQQDEATPRP